ncbi:hypothetical protein V6N13_039147 [Hibiscus sabdariffa]
MESKQLTLNEAAQPLKDPAGLSKKSEISRIGTLIQSVKKKNKETAQPVSISAGLVNNGRTSITTASKPLMKKKEKAQHP